jgi:hypothetical protein
MISAFQPIYREEKVVEIQQEETNETIEKIENL